MELPPGVPLDQLPGLAPPPGVTPNFVDPDNYQGTIIAVLAVCLTIATLLITLRLYTKISITKSIASEDYVSCLAWAGFVAFSVIIAITLHYGNGIHQWDVPLSNVMTALKLANAAEIAYCPVIFLTKLAILLQIMHIFVISRKSGRFYFVQLFIWSNALWYLINFFLNIVGCKPRAKLWNPMVSDVFIFLVPIFWVCKLQMAWRRKLGVSLVFASAMFACLSSIMRLITVHRWGKSPDNTWYLMYDGFWTLGEITGGITSGCLPTLPLAFAHFNSNILSIVSTYRSSKPRISGDYRTKVFGAFGAKKSSAAGAYSNDFLELRNQTFVPSNQQTLESKKNADRLFSESKSGYFIV